MALRNAFDLLATEGTLRQLLRMVTFAKDANDRLRVQVDNSPQVTIYNAQSSTTQVGANLQVSPFQTNSWNAMDAREPQRDQTLMAFQQTRNRWTIS